MRTKRISLGQRRVAIECHARLGLVSGALALDVLLLAACGGGDRAAARPDSATAGTTPAVGASGALPAPQPGAAPAGATAAMLAEGDSIFHSLKAGGLCQTCHGVDANGTPLAPSLTDTQWQTGDGSYAFIQKRVTEGMPNPTPPYTSPMLPMGGAQLTADQVKAVAAYVYSISHTTG